jgi:hypothetical protein
MKSVVPSLSRADLARRRVLFVEVDFSKATGAPDHLLPLNHQRLTTVPILRQNVVRPARRHPGDRGHGRELSVRPATTAYVLARESGVPLVLNLGQLRRPLGEHRRARWRRLRRRDLFARPQAWIGSELRQCSARPPHNGCHLLVALLPRAERSSLLRYRLVNRAFYEP